MSPSDVPAEAATSAGTVQTETGAETNSVAAPAGRPGRA